MVDDERRRLRQQAAAAEWWTTDLTPENPTPVLDTTPFRASSAASLMAALEARYKGLRPWMDQLERVAAAKAALELAEKLNGTTALLSDLRGVVAHEENELSQVPHPAADNLVKVVSLYGAAARIAYQEARDVGEGK